MAIQDSIQITTLERAVSTDFTVNRDLVNRSLVELAAALSRRKIQGGLVTQSLRDVASGLFLTHVLGAPWLTTGFLGQASAVPGVPPAPFVPPADTFDHPDFRFGAVLVPTALTDPHDGEDRWHLLQARVVRATTLSEIRDIYDPLTGVFAPSAGAIDKRYESQVETDWKAGTATTIPAADAGYVPLAALYRPAGGGAITAADIVQLSLQLDDLVPVDSDQKVAQRGDRRFYVDGGLGNPDDEARFSLSGIVGGVRLYAKCQGGIQLRTAVFVDPSDAGIIGVTGYWWYLYLCAPGGVVPSNLYGVAVDHRGVLVASRVPPSDFGVNSALIDIPLPIGGTVAAGDAVHVGFFRARGVLQDMDYIDISSNGDGPMEPIGLLGAGAASALNQVNSYGSLGSPYNLGTTGAGGTESVPYGCHLRGIIIPHAFDAAEVTAYSVLFYLASTTDAAGIKLFLSLRSHDRMTFELAPRAGNLSIIIGTMPLDIQLLPSAGGWPDVGGCEHWASFSGISF